MDVKPLVSFLPTEQFYCPCRWVKPASVDVVSTLEEDLVYGSMCNVPIIVSQMLIHGGGGFFIACEDFWKMFYHLLPACVFFFF